MSKVLYEKDGRIARVILNRPEKMNAIDNDLPSQLSAAVAKADSDSDIHVIVLSGAGKAFCSGYDLDYFTSHEDSNRAVQEMPWDPITDYQFMWSNTQHFMSLWRAIKPVLCKVHGYAIAGGSDIALCADFVIMEDEAEIGYMPARVWGSPTTAMWVYRLGAEKAKRMLFTGDKINGKEAEKLGLILKAVPYAQLDQEIEDLAARMASVPINQLAMQKMVVNQSIEQSINYTQRLSTLFDGIARHSPEGINFQLRAEKFGWKQAVKERDDGEFDWSKNKPISRSNPSSS